MKKTVENINLGDKVTVGINNGKIIGQLENVDCTEPWFEIEFEDKSCDQYPLSDIDFINPMTPEQKRAKQYLLSQEINSNAGINIVTCGNCGSVILHRSEDVEIECYDCGYESEPCDFPDLFHEFM